MKHTKRPKNWRSDPKVFEAYREGGTAIARAIYTDREQEKFFWKLLGPLKLWPRWYLSAFVTIWFEENRGKARTIRERRRRRGQSG